MKIQYKATVEYVAEIEIDKLKEGLVIADLSKLLDADIIDSLPNETHKEGSLRISLVASMLLVDGKEVV